MGNRESVRRVEGGGVEGGGVEGGGREGDKDPPPGYCPSPR